MSQVSDELETDLNLSMWLTSVLNGPHRLHTSLFTTVMQFTHTSDSEILHKLDKHKKQFFVGVTATGPMFVFHSIMQL